MLQPEGSFRQVSVLTLLWKKHSGVDHFLEGNRAAAARCSGGDPAKFPRGIYYVNTLPQLWAKHGEPVKLFKPNLNFHCQGRNMCTAHSAASEKFSWAVVGGGKTAALCLPMWKSSNTSHVFTWKNENINKSWLGKVIYFLKPNSAYNLPCQCNFWAFSYVNAMESSAKQAIL